MGRSNPFGSSGRREGPQMAAPGKSRVPLTRYGELDRQEVSRRVSVAFRAMGAKRKGG